MGHSGPAMQSTTCAHGVCNVLHTCGWTQNLKKSLNKSKNLQATRNGSLEHSISHAGSCPFRQTDSCKLAVWVVKAPHEQLLSNCPKHVCLKVVKCSQCVVQKTPIPKREQSPEAVDNPENGQRPPAPIMPSYLLRWHLFGHRSGELGCESHSDSHRPMMALIPFQLCLEALLALSGP
jgi:hypothetical protein|mmetsp:Transcript_22479/g.37600  ORF Transcript_22479/g.37600 Transcript_22479/m.37600 type:complete len:178 (+) Transcript_22479:531-1064(+)